MLPVHLWAVSCELVGAFGDFLRANDQTYQLQPDVILMDIDLPGRDSIQGVTSLHREFPAVLMQTIFDDDNLRRTRNDLTREVENLTNAQWYFRESPERWSITEVVEHLGTGRLRLPVKSAKASETHPTPTL